MLAKNLRTPRSIRFPALSLTTIASVLAPTGTSTYNPSFVSCLSKDSACKPPTRVAGTFWA
jgi:hypothetical protein